MDGNTANAAPSAVDVISALNQTGFILEYRVAKLVRQAGFDTMINHAFPDPESTKSREIDVVAEVTRQIKRIPVSISVAMKLILECKNTDNPFVIIGESDQDESHPSDTNILSFDPLAEFKFPKKLPHQTVYNQLQLSHLPGFRGRREFLGHQLVRMNRQNGSWKADNGSVYDSILYPMAKAWQHNVKDTEKANEEDPDWDLPYLDYLIPVIVTSGPVITVDASHDDPAVTEVGWASLRREFSSKDLPAYIHTDVVSFSHLAEYIESRPLSILNAAESVLKDNIHLYDPDWLLTNLGIPAAKEEFAAWHERIRAKSHKA